MRHSFASLMISNGEDILWVSNMLGHKDSSMTLEKYARYIKGEHLKIDSSFNPFQSSGDTHGDICGDTAKTLIS